MYSSVTLSHEACEPSSKAILSDASTCQTSWGVKARRRADCGRRPPGAGLSPAAANHRWICRAQGKPLTPDRSSQTRTTPAPHAGCSRRNCKADSRAASGVGDGRVGWVESGANPPTPRSRPRRISPRTVRGARANRSAKSPDENPC